MDLKACLLAIVLFVAVTHATSVNYGWTPGQEYVYRFTSRMVSGQPQLKQQFAAIEIKHKLVIQVQQQDLLLVKITDTNVGEMNEVILGNWWNTRVPEGSSVSSETKRMLETPFLVKMQEGQVQHIKVEDSEVHFVRNFKKALVSALQLDNRAINPASLNRVDNKIVKVMEETIQGECEVVYEKHLMPEHIQEVHQERVPVLEACRDAPVWEVTKTMNFTNCKTLPVYNTITPKGLHNCLPGDNACKLYWERTYQSRFVLCGGHERGLIQSIDAEEEFLVNPFGYKTEKLVGATTINMTLHDIRPITGHIRVPQNLMTIQSLEMKNPIFRHQQRQGDNSWTRSQDDFEYGQHVQYNTEDEQTLEGEQIHQSQYPSIYRDSDLYTQKYNQEYEQGYNGQNINEESDELTSGYGYNSARRFSGYGQSQKQSYWNRIFNPLQSSQYDQEEQYESTYPRSYGKYGSQYGSQDDSTYPRSWGKLDREDKLVKSGMYPYPTLTKPLLFVHPKRINFQEVIETIPEQVKEIALNLEHPSNLAQKNVLDKIVSVATKLELLSLEQLHKVYQRTVISSRHETSRKYDNEHQIQKTAKNIFLDALAMSGTNPAIVLIKQLIKNEEVRGEQAAQLVMTIPKYAKTPTKELINEIFDLATSINGEHKEQIKTTALLAFSQLVHQACVSPRSQFTRYPVEIFGKFCKHDSALIQKYVSYLAQKLHQTQSEYKKTVYIHALGNIGHKSIIQALKPIINNEIKSTADVRSKAIQALKKIVEPQSFYRKHEKNVVKHVAQFLVSVVLDPTIHYQVRMSAFEIFTVTDAPLVYWQKIAMRTWFEPSTQVAAYIRSTLKSFTHIETKIPHFLNLIKKAKQVLPLTKPIKEGLQYSYNHVISHYLHELELGYIQQISTYGAKDSIIPEAIKYNAIHQLGGFNFKPLEVVLQTKNIREVVEKLLHQHVFFPLSREGGYSSQLDKIKEVLGVNPRKVKGPLEGSLFVKIAEEIQRIFPVNHESLSHVIRKIVEEFPRLQNGLPINYQKTLKLADMTVILPTQLGVPYILKIRAPALLSLKGHIKVQTQPELRSHLGVPQKVKIVLDLNPVYTWKLIATSGFTTYSNLQTYATGVEKKFTFHLPGALVIRADLKDKQIAVTHVLPETHKVQNPTDVEIVTYKVKPFTTIYNLKKMASITHTDKLKTIKVTEEPKKVNKHIGFKYLGLAAKLEQVTDGELEDVHDILKKVFTHKATTLAHFWSAASSNKQRKYRLTLDLQQSQTKESTILFDFDKIVKSVASLETSEIESGRHFSQHNTQEQDTFSSRRHSGKFFPRSADYSKYETSEEQQGDFESFHGLKSEYNLDSDDEYTQGQQYGQGQQYAHGQQYGQGHQYSQGHQYGQEHQYSQGQQYGQGHQYSQGQQYAHGQTTKFEGHHETQLERVAVQKILAQITSGYIYKVKVAAIFRGTEKRDFAANLIVAMNPTNTIKKVQILLERSPLSHYERRSLKILVDAETKFPQVPISDLSIAQGMDMTSFLKAKIYAGHSIESQSQSQIRIEGVMKRNEEVKQFLDTQKHVAECEKNQQHGFRLHPTCVNATTVASMLNEYHFNIEYRNVPAQLKNLTYHLEELLQAAWYPYMFTNHVELSNQHNKVQVAIKVHPIQKNFDLKIKKPTATIVFNKVPLNTQKQTVFPIYAKKSIVARTFNKVLGGYYNTKCLMGHKKVATFDKVVYDAKLKNQAFHLLTKDCSGLYKFAVLVKQVESKKVVRVIAKNTVVQTLPAGSRSFSANGLQVLVNGRPQTLPVDKIVEITEQGKTVIRLIAKPNGVIEIRAPKHGFVVLTNGEQVIVKASNFLRGSLCGLCGDFNGEKTADLKTPEKCVESPRDAKDFVRSYAIETTSTEGRHHYNPEQEQDDQEHSGRRSFYSRVFGTPASYLSSVFGYRKYDNEQQDVADELTFGQRSQYTRQQCVRELDDSSVQGKQWRQQNGQQGLIGGGDHDYQRFYQHQQGPLSAYNSYDNEYEQNQSEDSDVFENMWQNRQHRQRFQDQDDFDTETSVYNQLESGVFNQDSLFENDFAGRQFGQYEDSEYPENDAFDREWGVQSHFGGLRSQYNSVDEDDEEQSVRRHQYGSDSEMGLDAVHRSPYQREHQYGQEYDSELFNREYNVEQGKYDNESDEEQQDFDVTRRNQYNRNADSDETNTQEEEEYEQDQYEQRTPFGVRGQRSHSQRRCTVLKHKIVERNGKMCFSIRPRIQCNKYNDECKPVQHQTKQVKFYCAQTPLEARHLESKVQQQSVVQQLTQKPVHFTEQIELPVECSARSY